MSRKGQGISINMVIITAIALIVLVIAVILVTKAGKNTDMNTGANSCLANGGVCKAPANKDANDAALGELGQMGCKQTEQCFRYNFGG